MISGLNYVTSFNTSIFAIAGYYTDSDRLQHVVAASNDGYVYQVHWDPNDLPALLPAERLGESFGNSMKTIAGFFTPDDKSHHAVVGTIDPNPPYDGKLHELYYKLGESPSKTDLPSDISGFQARCGMASFYSPYDYLRHVVIIDRMGKLEDITWRNALHPEHHTITIPLSANQIASISSFLSHDENPNTRHIIVAQNDHGHIYDIDYPDEDHVPQDIRGQDNVYVKTSFDYPVQNVTAFFSSDNNYRHIVVLTREFGQNWLKLRAYDTYGRYLRSTPLTSLPGDVADITSFYNAHDQLCHVLYAKHDGSLYEITYTSQE